jgi:hypothetical protein
MEEGGKAGYALNALIRHLTEVMLKLFQPSRQDIFKIFADIYVYEINSKQEKDSRVAHCVHCIVQ